MANKVLNNFNFTFHSGYIPIDMAKFNYIGIHYFTFHSGYIPINFTVLNRKPYWPLHSILDIFQYVSYNFDII